MTGPAISIEGVGKRYTLGTTHEGNLTAAIAGAARAPLRLLRGRSEQAKREDADEFWALRDVSFEIQQGEMLGMIGANGAGKSTLLKLFAQITPPTEGRIRLRGRVGSLLEVGTGFHPELSGRENVFLNGSILGMRRQEIAARFDEIVEFSGIETFIDTPVKRYSSGMFVRLAFSVAAHLEPEILLVDEVLAVGDAEFQRRCLNKMREVAERNGCTIVFVSHNLSWVRKLCDRAVYLEKGQLQLDGPASKVVGEYMERVESAQHGGVAVIKPETRRSGTGHARLTRVALLDDHNEPIDRVRFGQPFTVALRFAVERPIEDGIVVIRISDPEGEPILTNQSTEHGRPELRLEPGTVEVRARIDVTLLPGEFVIDGALVNSQGAEFDFVERVLSFTALNVPQEGSDDHYPWETARGLIRPDCEWEVGAPPDSEVLATGPAVRGGSPGNDLVDR